MQVPVYLMVCSRFFTVDQMFFQFGQCVQLACGYSLHSFNDII